MGSLYDVLNKQTISTRQFCDIAVSAAKGKTVCVRLYMYTVEYPYC